MKDAIMNAHPTHSKMEENHKPPKLLSILRGGQTEAFSRRKDVFSFVYNTKLSNQSRRKHLSQCSLSCCRNNQRNYNSDMQND